MNTHREESGSLLLMALFLILGVGAMLAATVNLSGVETLETIESTQGERALFLAESGLERAKYALHVNLCATTGLTLPLSGQLASSESYAVNITSLGNNQFQLDATGSAKTAQRRTREVVSCSVQGVWGTGLIGCNGVTMGGTVLTYGLDSDTGQTNLNNGDVRTINPNAPISLSGHVNVHGSVYATGAGSNLSIGGSSVVYGDAHITGTITGASSINGVKSANELATTTAADCDPLNVTSLVSSKMSAYLTSKYGGHLPTVTNYAPAHNTTTTINTATDYYVSAYDLSASHAAVTLQGPGSGGTRNFNIYIVGGGGFTISNQSSLSLTNGANVTLYMAGGGSFSVKGTLYIDPTSSLTVYTTGPVDLEAQGNAGNVADAFRIYSSSNGSVGLGGGSSLTCAVYAPLATVTMLGNSTLIGAMRGYVITKDNGTPNFYYDEDLRDLTEGGKGVISTVSWSEQYQ
ncbi:MAG: hypothetical protein HQL66_00075 [Magnetococcales bacterium]|nr:hypothetical protein [Magnetococcales bacterium]